MEFVYQSPELVLLPSTCSRIHYIMQLLPKIYCLPTQSSAKRQAYNLYLMHLLGFILPIKYFQINNSQILAFVGRRFLYSGHTYRVFRSGLYRQDDIDIEVVFKDGFAVRQSDMDVRNDRDDVLRIHYSQSPEALSVGTYELLHRYRSSI